jgi:hypothetical protein
VRARLASRRTTTLTAAGSASSTQPQQPQDVPQRLRCCCCCSAAGCVCKCGAAVGCWRLLRVGLPAERSSSSSSSSSSRCDCGPQALPLRGARVQLAAHRALRRLNRASTLLLDSVPCAVLGATTRASIPRLTTYMLKTPRPWCCRAAFKRLLLRAVSHTPVSRAAATACAALRARHTTPRHATRARRHGTPAAVAPRLSTRLVYCCPRAQTTCAHTRGALR